MPVSKFALDKLIANRREEQQKAAIQRIDVAIQEQYKGGNAVTAIFSPAEIDPDDLRKISHLYASADCGWTVYVEPLEQREGEGTRFTLS